MLGFWSLSGQLSNGDFDHLILEILMATGALSAQVDEADCHEASLRTGRRALIMVERLCDLMVEERPVAVNPRIIDSLNFLHFDLWEWVVRLGRLVEDSRVSRKARMNPHVTFMAAAAEAMGAVFGKACDNIVADLAAVLYGVSVTSEAARKARRREADAEAARRTKDIAS
jgi:hypothetical protein